MSTVTARRLALAALLGMGTAAAPRAGVLVVRVTDAGTQRPVPNAEVRDLDAQVSRLTDERGEATLPLGSVSSARVRVRQLGYRAVERTVARRGSASVDTVDVALVRAAVALPATVATASSTCMADVDSAASALSLAALGQLRFAAEQYDRFREAYPFRLFLQRRTVRLPSSRSPGRVEEHEERLDAEDWGERYRPGEVYHRQRRGFGVSILFLSMLADSTFWESHCLVARQVRGVGTRRLIPLEFSPAPTIHDPDWGGTAWLDSASGTLHRVDFQLFGLDERADIRRLEGYITMTYPSPYVARPDSIVAGWWYTAPADTGSWGAPSVVQLLHLKRVEYRKGAPPDSAQPVTK